MLQELAFTGQWRHYQKRVLDKSDAFMADGHLHLVAAPGSGKTTLGIEFIRRFGQPTLILAPTVTIRQQWVDRIIQAFLSDESQAEQLISQDLKHPKLITVATYQALHSAMNQVVGQSQAEDTDDQAEIETFDFKGFDIFSTFKEISLGTLCLDECHHLRNEWWKSLEAFRQAFPDLKMISLTATPPYEGDPALWDRYIRMCGEIDEEITVPELVKEDTLCPHQDYVYFAFPTKEEQEQLDAFSQQKNALLQQLTSDPLFCQYLQTCQALSGQISDDELLNEPKYLSATLIFLRSKGIAFPKRFQDLLGAKKLPAFTLDWLEILLQGLLFQVPHWYNLPEEYEKQLLHELKAASLIDRKQVKLVRNKKQDLLLNQSLGKLNAVREIFKAEYQALGSQLRQLVLTDYIRQDFEVHLGDKDAQFTQLGVLSYFESIRRESLEQATPPAIAVLTGSIVIIPTVAKPRLEELLGGNRLTYQSVGQLSPDDFLKVRLVGSQHDLVTAVTQLFQEGLIQVVIGTKSLLGEGWDAPCVNSLILASFVGSFMLSNQMRGRAIRVWPEDPDKTSNIWHLVSINLSLKKWYEKSDLEKEEIEAITDQLKEYSPDLELLERRMKQFLGLHYKEPFIESGIERLAFDNIRYTKKQLQKLNEETLERSTHRQELRDGWQKALPILENMEIANEVQVDKHFLPLALFFDARKLARWLTAATLTDAFANLFYYSHRGGGNKASLILLVVLAVLALLAWLRYYLYKSPYKRLEVFGQAIHQALLLFGHIQTQETRIQVVRDRKDAINTLIYLKGGTMREKELFSQTMIEFFAPIENQRYILKAQEKVSDQTEYFAVPSLFDKRKEDALAFVAQIRKSLGKYDLVYTRSAEGRAILLDARIKALANKQERTFTKKQVMSNLK